MFPRDRGFSVFDVNAYPDIAGISNANAFSITLDSITLNLGDNLNAESDVFIQYFNGQFSGLVFNGDFAFNNTFYQLSVNTSSVRVFALDGIPNVFDPHGFPVCCSDLMHGHINIGNGNLTDRTPFTPTPPNTGGGGVPEPASWALMIVGFGAVGGMMRRRHAKVFA